MAKLHLCHSATNRKHFSPQQVQRRQRERVNPRNERAEKFEGRQRHTWMAGRQSDESVMMAVMSLMSHINIIISHQPPPC